MQSVCALTPQQTDSKRMQSLYAGFTTFAPRAQCPESFNPIFFPTSYSHSMVNTSFFLHL